MPILDEDETTARRRLLDSRWRADGQTILPENWQGMTLQNIVATVPHPAIAEHIVALHNASLPSAD
jgi:hypothetical protein